MKRREIRIRVDGYTRLCLTAIAVLLTVVVLGLWCDGVRVSNALRADDGTTKFGETPGRIAALLDSTQQINAKLDEISKLMTSGQAKVQVVPDATKTAPTGGAGAPDKTK